MTKRRFKHNLSSKKRKSSKKEEKKDFVFYLKKFLFWFLVYFISISLISILFQNTQIYQNKIGFYIIMGYLLVLISRVIYSATKNRELRLSGIVLWGLIYTISYGLIDFFLGNILTFSANPTYGLFINIAIFSVVFTLVLMFLRRMKIKKKRRGVKAPSQIFTGILLIVAGILSWRFSTIVFLNWFNWVEGLAWSWLIGLALIIGGGLVLLAWWRNNVLQHRFGLKIGKW
jgi:hypothetical protein